MNSLHVGIIVPYFGRFPSTFQLWLKSCKNNPEFDWLIFTDDEREFEYPENVHVTKCTFSQVRQRFERSLGFETALSKPYKLCDFKPLYGYLFQKEIGEYDFWGYCDIDLFFGKLSHFITQKMLTDYDKISVLGHLCIVRNTQEINQAYQMCNFKELLQDSRIRVFDEVRFSPNINELLRGKGFRILPIIPYADIDEEHFNFHLFQYEGGTHGKMQDYLPTVYAVDSNGAYSVSVKNGMIEKLEVAYVHFQKREIEVCISTDSDSYILIPNKVVPFGKIDVKYLQMHSKDSLLYFVDRRLKRIWRAIKARIK